MSLATRCPACGTVFRVVQDQLRVSEGWVRCGRCSDVFNAVDHLVELARTAAAPPEFESTIANYGDDAGHEAMLHDEPLGLESVAVEPAAGEASATREVIESLDLPGEPEPVAITLDADEQRDARDALDATDAPTPIEPSFLQAARRSQRWQRPLMRRSLGALAILGLLLLLLQAVVEYRDLVAARWMSGRSLLESACRWGGCRIEPPRLIEALVVDSSGLVRVEGTNNYRFSVVLRNRSAMELAAPVVELTLSDTQGRVISKRSLSIAELGSATSIVPAGAELPLSVTLAVADRPVAGYTIEVFYP